MYSDNQKTVEQEDDVLESYFEPKSRLSIQGFSGSDCIIQVISPEQIPKKTVIIYIFHFILKGVKIWFFYE